jgi:hypothetical protein
VPRISCSIVAYVLPEIAYLGLVIVDVGSGLILNRLALEENLNQLADGPEVRIRGELTILLLCGGQKNFDWAGEPAGRRYVRLR